MQKSNSDSFFQQKNSQGLGSIVEELENSPRLSEDDTSDGSDDGDNASTSSSNKTQRSVPTRRRGSGLPLWQIKSMQNELVSTPSPTLKRKLMKIESPTSLSDQQESLHSTLSKDQDDREDGKDELACTDEESGIDNVDQEILHNARVSADSISLDSDTVIQNFESVDRFQRRSRTISGTEYRRNRYAVSYFATNNNNDFTAADNNTMSSPSVIQNQHVRKSGDSSCCEEHQPCSSLSDDLKDHHHHHQSYFENGNNKPITRNSKIQRQMTLTPSEKPLPVENKDITASICTEGDITLQPDPRDVDHSKDSPPPPKILIGAPSDQHSNLQYNGKTSVKHGKDKTLLDSSLLADQDQGIYSQCSNSSSCNVGKGESVGNLTSWIHQLQSCPPSAFTSRSASHESVDLYNVENLQHVCSEIGTLRNEIQEIKSGMLALTEFMRISSTNSSSAAKESIKEDSV